VNNSFETVKEANLNFEINRQDAKSANGLSADFADYADSKQEEQIQAERNGDYKALIWCFVVSV
jgi:hypothetical protein